MYYNLVEKYVGSSVGIGSVLTKVLVDQLVYGPFAITVFFGFATIRNPLSSDAIVEFSEKMESSFLSTYIADWCVWPFVNVINFRYIGVNFRPTFIASVQVFWQTYMSYAGFGHSKDKDCQTNTGVNECTQK